MTPADEVDHVVPLFKGGTNDESNLQPLCRPCHVDKTTADAREARPIGHDAQGVPLHPSHPWNTER